jgi:hypothetical protein
VRCGRAAAAETLPALATTGTTSRQPVAGAENPRWVRRRAASVAAVELTAHTTWESLTAIRAFAGDDVTTAKVEPEAPVMLADSDPAVVHRTVLVSG